MIEESGRYWTVIFLASVDLVCVFEAGDSIREGHVKVGVVWLVAAIVFSLIGYNWPKLKKRLGNDSSKQQAEANNEEEKPQTADQKSSEPDPTPEPTLLTLMDTSFPQFGKKWQDVTVQFDDGSSLQVRSALYFEFHSNATFLGFYVPSSPNTMSACFVLATQAREIAQQLAGAGLQMIVTNPGEQSQELTDYRFTGKVYIYHEDRLTHKQMGEVEVAYKAQELPAILRGPDFLTRAWIAWKERGQPNITWDTISLQKLVFENGAFRRFVPYEKAVHVRDIYRREESPDQRPKGYFYWRPEGAFAFQIETRGI